MTREQILAVAKPILFNTEMVQALLDDRKHVTRRVVKLDFKKIYGCACAAGKWNESYGGTLADIPPQIIEWYVTEKAKSPYRPGDLLYVRETWTKWKTGGYLYRAWPGFEPKEEDEALKKLGLKWHPSIHMPKEAARIFLRVKDVRVERLQDITEKKAEAEGCTAHGGNFALDEFEAVWQSTIRKEDSLLYSWEANPWVWVIEFEKVAAE